MFCARACVCVRARRPPSLEVCGAAGRGVEAAARGDKMDSPAVVVGRLRGGGGGRRNHGGRQKQPRTGLCDRSAAAATAAAVNATWGDEFSTTSPPALCDYMRSYSCACVRITRITHEGRVRSRRVRDGGDEPLRRPDSCIRIIIITISIVPFCKPSCVLWYVLFRVLLYCTYHTHIYPVCRCDIT